MVPSLTIIAERRSSIRQEGQVSLAENRRTAGISRDREAAQCLCGRGAGWRGSHGGPKGQADSTISRARTKGSIGLGMKCTAYFAAIRNRPDRAAIRDEWIRQAISTPLRETTQSDGRIRRWT